MPGFTKCFGSCLSNFRKKPPKEIEPDSAIGGLLQSYPANPIQHPELNPELSEMAPNLENIIAFVNPKSGGQKGRVVFERLKNYLHKDNVFDLTKGGPKPGLEKHGKNKNLRVIACGGDGTVGWVLSVLDQMVLENPPSVAILPLGTGNDLARTMGWGGGYNNESMEAFLNKVIHGKVVRLDRWTIKTVKTVPTKDDDISSEIKSEEKLPLDVLNNYFSIGADAKIALDFHHARQKNPELFTSQAFNKIEYVKNFSKDLLNQSCKNITEKITVFECDGQDYLEKLRELDCHSIVVLNIPSYASGNKPWKNGDEGFDRQSFSDGKLEIIGFHTKDFMFLQLGGHGDSIAQASKIRIVTECPLPMQVDGEPVMLQSCEISIDKKNQALMVLADETSTSTIRALASMSSATNEEQVSVTLM